MAAAARHADLFRLPEEAGTPPAGNTFVDGEFWLVICTEANEYWSGAVHLTRGYRYVHESEISAEREAKRLAEAFRGTEFAVVKSVASVRYDDKGGRLVWEECRG